MKKSRMMAGVISIMIGTMALPVSAADTMTVTYSQQTTYTLSIPATIVLSADNESKASNIGVSVVNTAPDKKVRVSIQDGITTAHQVELLRTGDNSTKVISDVTDKDGLAVSNGSVVAEFQDMSVTPITAGTGVLNFSAIKDSAGGTVKAGSYTGTIVFKGEVVDR